MLGYFEYFKEKISTELRTTTFLNGDNSPDSIPDGKFVFTEYFCTDPACNCERVLVKVLCYKSDDARPEDVATFGYTWNESNDELWTPLATEVPNPYLDPLHPQVRYANALLSFWSDMVKHDQNYSNRLQRHYRELRAARPLPYNESDYSPVKRSSNTGPQPLTKDARARRRKLKKVKRLRK